jgi:hypothetical protein
LEYRGKKISGCEVKEKILVYEALLITIGEVIDESKIGQ